MLGIIIRFEIEIEMIWKFPTPEKTHTHTHTIQWIREIDGFICERERENESKKTICKSLGLFAKVKVKQWTMEISARFIFIYTVLIFCSICSRNLLTLPLIYSTDFIFRQCDATLFHSIPNARENATELSISLSLARDDYYSFCFGWIHITNTIIIIKWHGMTSTKD